MIVDIYLLASVLHCLLHIFFNFCECLSFSLPFFPLLLFSESFAKLLTPRAVTSVRCTFRNRLQTGYALRKCVLCAADAAETRRLLDQGGVEKGKGPKGGREQRAKRKWRTAAWAISKLSGQQVCATCGIPCVFNVLTLESRKI